MEFKSRNTNTVAPLVYQYLRLLGEPRLSRNGPVVVAPEPVTICLQRPFERVNFSPVRNANPFFHLMEALAMLVGGGGNRAPFLSHFAKQMGAYTDDGLRYHAFYGERLRARWGDQLGRCIGILELDKDSRQAVAGLYDPALDLMSAEATRDRACNLALVFAVNNEGAVTLTSFNRSNDAVWGGVTGANIVHLSFFQEYVACALGRPVGPWWHTSANLHAYTGNPLWEALREVTPGNTDDPYLTSNIGPHVPLFDHATDHRCDFDSGLRQVMAWCTDHYWALQSAPGELRAVAYKVPFLADVAVPMYNAWQAHRRHQDDAAYEELEYCTAGDWRYAGLNWLKRAERNE